MSRRDRPQLIRAAALAAGFAVAIAAAAAVGRQAWQALPPPAPRDAGPLGAELDRCRALGSRAQDDPVCREAWRTSRERFLGVSSERQP